MEVQQLAKQAYDWLEYVREDDPKGRRANIVVTKDGSPDWLTDLIYESHDGMLPDDRTYALVQDVLGAIADGADEDDGPHEFADSAVDIYTADRFAWLASNLNRSSYVDEAREEGLIGPDSDIADQIGLGQYIEAVRVFSSVYRSLENFASDWDDDEEAS